jgi:hypothetical protein
MHRRPILFFLLLTGLAPSARCADPVSVKILQLGLEGTLSRNGEPAWIQIQASNTTSESLTFDLTTFEANLDAGASPISEICTIPLTLMPDETRVLDVPLHIVPLEHAVISAQALDSHGFPIGRTGRRVGQKSDGYVIALLCSTPDLCRSIQQSILLTGSPEEQTHKSQSLRLLQLSEAPRVEWAYAPANSIILAAPASNFSAPQREALELYLHGGGKLVLVEDQLHDDISGNSTPPAFLDVYRHHAEEGKTLSVGEGRFTKFTSITSKDFSNFFRPLGFTESTPDDIRKQLARFNRGVSPGEPGTGVAWLMSRLGTHFRFPSFLALLLWVIAYLLLVGLVNFVVLRRAGHPEWAWVTIPAIAILFSILLYAVSARNHPRNFGLDEMTVYRMDNLSPLATSLSKVRVSAPERSFVEPLLPAELVYTFPRQNSFQGGDVVFSGGGMNGSVNEFQLGRHWQTRLFLRRWSFRDLDFQGHHRFAGTVSRDSQGRLHNDTGINYSQAIVVDQDDVFLLDKFPAGAVVDLAHVPRRPYAQESGRMLFSGRGYPAPPFAYQSTQGGWQPSEKDSKRFDQEYNALRNQPFSIVELIRGWSPLKDEVFSETKAVFFGLSSEATLDGSLHNLSPDIKSGSLTIVTFEAWP